MNTSYPTRGVSTEVPEPSATTPGEARAGNGDISNSPFRLDRTLSLHVVGPASRLLSGKREFSIPILMYHGIQDQLECRRPYYETNTSPALFARQMRYLKQNGYRTLGLSEAINRIVAGLDCQKCVVITFDDGYRNFYTNAFPVFAELDQTATVYVVSGLVGGDAPVHYKGKEYLTWKEVRELHEHGIHIGSHTVSHPELYTLDREEIEFQLEYSKKTIEEQLGDPVQSFSYPYAFPEADRGFVRRFRDQLHNEGYENGVSTIIGTAERDHDWFFLPRLPVNSFDDLALFQAKLEGKYDWMHAPQHWYKTIQKLAFSFTD